jgi:hypothetical protein
MAKIMSMNHLDSVDSQTGKTPKTRVSDGETAQRICQKLIDNNKGRNRRNALVQGLIDGNPPYKREKLKASGQAYRSNFNDGGSLALQEITISSYYDLFSEVPYFAEIKPDTGNPEVDHQLGQELTDSFHELQLKDSCMEDLINVSHHEMVTFGAGPAIFDREDDWSASPVKYDDFLLDNNEPSEMSKWTKLCVRDCMTVSELMSKIQEEKAAATRGWNVQNVKKSIMLASDHKSDNLNGQDWQKLQQAIRQNDLDYTGPDRSVEVGRLFFREFPTKEFPEGGITEVAIDLGKGATHGFLYQKIRKYKNWSELTQPFMLNRGTGKYHSIKGVGVRMFSMMQTKLRLDNAVVDAAFFASSIHAQQKSQGKTGREGHVFMGPITMWKPDFQPMNFSNVGSSITTASTVSAQIDNRLQGNLSQFRPDPQKPVGNPRSATEVAAIVQQQSVLSKTQIARYFAQLDGFYSERFKRAAYGPLNGTTETAKLAREWRKKLAEKGIDESILKTCKVTATRTVGQGSHFLRQQTLSGLWAGVAGVLPEGGKQALLDDMIASHAGFDRVARYNPRNKMSVSEQDHAWDAEMENGNIMAGGDFKITDSQDDFIHAVVHLEELQEGLAGVGQGTDPMKIAMFGHEIRPHIEEHISRITDDPLRKDKVKALMSAREETYKQLDTLIAALQEEQQQQQAQAQEAPQVSFEQQKAQIEMEQKQQKHDQEMKFAEERHRQQLAINDAHAANQVRNAD